MAKKNSSAQKVFSDVANEWLSVTSLRVKLSTSATYAATLVRHILPSLGNRRVKDLNASDISEFAKTKLKSGRLDKKGGLSAKTVYDMLSIIKSIMNYALDMGVLSHRIKVPYPKLQRRTMRVLNRDEQKLLESSLTKNVSTHKLGVLLCLYTGIRIGELCALAWQDISFEQGMITIKRTLQRVKDFEGRGAKTKIVVDSPKSPCSIRNIPIPKFLSEMMQKHAKSPHEYFLATDKVQYTEPRTMQNHFARMLKQSNIPKANFHSTRHTFATRCVEAGVDIKSLSEMLGHSNVNITLNRYVHSSIEQKRKCIDKLERFVRP